MSRLIAFLAIVAALLVAITQFLLPGIADQAEATRIGGVSSSTLTIDTVSFALGAAVGAAAILFVTLPWSELPRMVGDILRIWRRYMIFTTLAGLCMGVLLFY